jgi:hypothetical protein
MSDDGAAAASPAEERLDEHLEHLRREEAEAEADTSLTHRIVSTARWQRALRAPVSAIASVVGAVLDGLTALVGGRRKRSP